MDTDLAFILVIGSIGTVFFVYVQLDRERAVIAAWQHFADERGGRMRREHCQGVVRRHIPMLEMPIDDALVRVEGISNRWKSRSSFTYIRARYLVPGTGPRFRVARSPLHLRAMRSVEGMSKVALGVDADFDRTFSCHYADPERAKRVLNLHTTRRLLTFPDLVVACSDASEIFLGFGYLYADTARLSNLVQLVADLASADLCALASLHANVPDGVYVPPRGPWERRTTPRVELRSPLERRSV